MKLTLVILVFATITATFFGYQMGGQDFSIKKNIETNKLVESSNAKSELLGKNEKVSKIQMSQVSNDKIAKLESEIEILENEMAMIDIEKELNSLETSSERRSEIILKANTYALKLGELARLEAAFLENGGEK